MRISAAMSNASGIPKYLTGFSVALASDDYDCSFPILLQSLPFCRASRFASPFIPFWTEFLPIVVILGPLLLYCSRDCQGTAHRHVIVILVNRHLPTTSNRA